MWSLSSVPKLTAQTYNPLPCKSPSDHIRGCVPPQLWLGTVPARTGEYTFSVMSTCNDTRPRSPYTISFINRLLILFCGVVRSGNNKPPLHSLIQRYEAQQFSC